MKYLNLSVSLAQDEMILKSTATQIGIWFQLQCYCHHQMNGGMIAGCQGWPDEIWKRIAGVKGREIARESPLWHFSGMVLVVHLYDVQAEESYRRKQQMGREYVERRWSKHRLTKVVKMPSRNHGDSQKSQKRNDS